MNQEQRRADFLEQHYTLGELSKAWRCSVRSLRPWFIDEPGVIKYGTPKLKRGRKRAYVSLRVPESVARRVYQRITGNEIVPSGREFTPPKKSSSASPPNGDFT